MFGISFFTLPADEAEFAPTYVATDVYLSDKVLLITATDERTVSGAIDFDDPVAGIVVGSSKSFFFVGRITMYASNGEDGVIVIKLDAPVCDAALDVEVACKAYGFMGAAEEGLASVKGYAEEVLTTSVQ